MKLKLVKLVKNIPLLIIFLSIFNITFISTDSSELTNSEDNITISSEVFENDEKSDKNDTSVSESNNQDINFDDQLTINLNDKESDSNNNGGKIALLASGVVGAGAIYVSTNKKEKKKKPNNTNNTNNTILTHEKVANVNNDTGILEKYTTEKNKEIFNHKNVKNEDSTLLKESNNVINPPIIIPPKILDTKKENINSPLLSNPINKTNNKVLDPIIETNAIKKTSVIAPKSLENIQNNQKSSILNPTTLINQKSQSVIAPIMAIATKPLLNINTTINNNSSLKDTPNTIMEKKNEISLEIKKPTPSLEIKSELLMNKQDNVPNKELLMNKQDNIPNKEQLNLKKALTTPLNIEKPIDIQEHLMKNKNPNITFKAEIHENKSQAKPINLSNQSLSDNPYVFTNLKESELLQINNTPTQGNENFQDYKLNKSVDETDTSFEPSYLGYNINSKKYSDLNSYNFLNQGKLESTPMKSILTPTSNQMDPMVTSTLNPMKLMETSIANQIHSKVKGESTQINPIVTATSNQMDPMVISESNPTNNPLNIPLSKNNLDNHNHSIEHEDHSIIDESILSYTKNL